MRRGTGRINYLIAIVVMLSCLSCNSSLVYTDSKTIDGAVWDLFDKAEFEFRSADTLKSLNVSLTLRTASHYPYRNIFLFVTTTAPDGKSITDTLEYQLADDKGHWLGKGFGDIHELNLPYKKNVFFPMKGSYVFSIQHGMRDHSLRGVYDLGISIVNFEL
ncbi:MAG: gliding motility lipoprotein GldH [Bacteroidales bacterium]|nr:gliding motility lipoprotein GldH [Bacteroidales bacterium]MBN2633764.1 gliding motility lipoprotein GldH [Bacteroidales bacterium]